MPSRVVIIGGTGFVGRALIKYLHGLNVDTLSISSNNLDFSKETAESRLLTYLRPSDSLVILSMVTPDKIITFQKNILSRSSNSLRGNSSPSQNTFLKSYSSNIDAFLANIQIMDVVCKVLKKIACAHVVYFSSDAVYSYHNFDISEQTPPSPDSLYGMAHLLREKMLQESFNGPLIIVRSTQIYGMHDTHNAYGPSRMLHSALKEDKIILFGNGEEMRDHIFIDDIVKLTLQLLQNKSFGILNAVTGISYTFSTVAEIIKDIIKKPIEIIAHPRQREITHRRFDARILQRSFPSLDFQTLKSGLLLMRDRIQENDRCLP